MVPRAALLVSAWRIALLRQQASATATAAAVGPVRRPAATLRAFSSDGSTRSQHQQAEATLGPPRDLHFRSDTTLAISHAPPVVYHPLYSAPQMPPRHRFPMAVFANIHRLLLEEGTVDPRQVLAPAALPSAELLHLVHGEEYVGSFCSGTLDEQRMRRIGFGDVTRTQQLIDRTLSEVAGTIFTAELALQHGLACNTAGGTHHAFRDHGSGFCIINDLAITAELLLHQERVKRVLILDLDVHQGDGTASIFNGRDDVFTLSVHADSNFPARKQASHLDIALPDGAADGEYLRVVAEAVTGVLQSFRPDIVLYDAGVDPHVDDALGRLALTDEGLHRRELLVLDSCLGMGVPVAGYVGGGYHADLDVLAARHCWLHRAAAQLWQDHGL